ncbi:MAG: DUF58 domain-containing protein [Bacteroidetes bacterium]|nr:DUF58 domain-containing protein [Bacteroidota bacterium]
MEISEIIAKIKQIELKSRLLSENIFSGEYHTAFKGRGMAFSEVRKYQFGDDIRSIDWNVTARHIEPHIKIFEEERELSIMFLIDVSSSNDFGGKTKTKKELALEILGVLLFSALANNDTFGAIFISDKIEKYIAPAKGKNHIFYILQEFLMLSSNRKSTNLKIGLDFLRERIKKKSVVFVLSDFIDDSNYLNTLKWVSKKHDTIAVQLKDELEEQIPNIGIVQFEHAETGEKEWVDTSIPEVRRFIAKQMEFRSRKLEIELKKINSGYILLNTAEDFVKPLHYFFKNR